MIIQCPHCHTRFRLDPAQLSEGRSLKCGRCQFVFAAPTPPQTARPRARSSPREQNLSFSFDDDDEWQVPEPTGETVPEDPVLLNGSDAPAPPAPPAPKHPRAAMPVRRAATPSEDFVIGDEDGSEDDRFDDELEETEPTEAAGGITIRSVFVFLILVVCGYGALTWTLLDDPQWAARLAHGLPLIGREVRERAAGEDIALIEIQGRYERTKDGKVVFLITGKAVNRSAESLRGVQVLTRLYDPGDRPLDEQVSACGNPMEARIGDLSIHQVAILRAIRPPPDFSVQPGAQCPFVAIFFDVPPAVTTFSAEIARAQRQV